MTTLKFFGEKNLWKYIDVKVFNRWGELVFQSNDFNFTWDGTYKGVVQNPAVFVFYIDLIFIDDYRMTDNKGSVTLIR